MSKRTKSLNNTDTVMIKDPDVAGLYVRDPLMAKDLRKHDERIWNSESQKKLDVILKKIDESLDLDKWGV